MTKTPSKPSLYAELPIGTRLFVETCFIAPSGNWAYCTCTVARDLGEEVEVEVTTEEAASRRVPTRFKVFKSRIRSIIA